jgi:hypothetical protein
MRKFSIAFLILPLLCHSLKAESPVIRQGPVPKEDVEKEILAGDNWFDQFQPSSDGRSFTFAYTVHYRLMWIDFVDLANAHIDIIPGRWYPSTEPGAEPVEAVKIQFLFDTLESPKFDRSARVVMHNKMEAILEKEGLQTRVFRKRYNEKISILGKKKKQNDLDLYVFSDEDLYHLKTDFLANTTVEETITDETFRQQGGEISNVLKVIADLTREESDVNQLGKNGKSVMSLQLQSEGKVQKFDLEGEKEEIEIPGNAASWDSLKISAKPAGNNVGSSRKFILWAVPYNKLAPAFGVETRVTKNKRSMYALPAIVEFDIGLGAIRCYLNNLEEELLSEIAQSEMESQRLPS